MVNNSLRCEYSYPPVRCASTLRANLKGFPVLYASDDPLTAIIEVLDKGNIDEKKCNELIGKKYCVSRWEVESVDNMIFTPFLFDGVHLSNPYITLMQLYQKEFGKQLSALTQHQQEGFDEINKFLTRTFIKDDDHALSSFIAHHHLYSAQLVQSDIFIYPSVRKNTKTVNFAVHPNFADENMKIKSLYCCKIEDVRCIGNKVEFIHVNIVCFGHRYQNRILWNEITANDKRFSLSFIEDWFDSSLDDGKVTVQFPTS